MNSVHEVASKANNPSKSKNWMLCTVALVSFGVGSLLTARLVRASRVEAGSDRVFELMIYHTLPGKATALESVFRDSFKLQRQHGLDVIGYWVPVSDQPAWANTFVYIVAHPSRDEAKKNWSSLHRDPAFQPYVHIASELIEHSGDDYRVEEVYMRPTDFSAMK